MTDADLVAKKLAFIETCVAELKTLARPELIEQDLREERFAAHTLQIAIQAALDVASHIVSDDRLGEPDSNRAMFELLVSAGRVPAELAPALSAMVGFRNILVHGYQVVESRVVRDVVEHRLGDLLRFTQYVRQSMTRNNP